MYNSVVWHFFPSLFVFCSWGIGHHSVLRGGLGISVGEGGGFRAWYS